MTQVERLIEALEERYRIKIADFIDLYMKDYPRDDMALELKVNTWAIRAVANALNLRMGKRFRAHDHALYLSRFSEKAEDLLALELSEAHEDLDMLSKELILKEKALNKSRIDLAKYKRTLNTEISVYDRIKSVMDEAIASVNSISTKETPPLFYKDSAYRDYTQIIVLSDLHFEEAVSAKDVGSNTFNWEIANARLFKVFQEAVNAYRGEESIIVALLGDMISGIIHDSLEATTKSTGEAIAELAKIIADYLIMLSNIYPSVYVPCVHGNHGRISENKKSTSSGFNFEYMMYNMIKGLVASADNVIIDISTTGLLACYAGSEHKIIGFHHGDFFKFVGDVKFLRVKEAFRQTTGHEPDIIIQGHTHCFQIEEMPRGGKYITNGSLIGVNGYSHTNGMLGKSWGQVIMSLLPSGEVENVRLIQ